MIRLKSKYGSGVQILSERPNPPTKAAAAPPTASRTPPSPAQNIDTFIQPLIIYIESFKSHVYNTITITNYYHDETFSYREMIKIINLTHFGHVVLFIDYLIPSYDCKMSVAK